MLSLGKDILSLIWSYVPLDNIIMPISKSWRMLIEVCVPDYKILKRVYKQSMKQTIVEAVKMGRLNLVIHLNQRLKRGTIPDYLLYPGLKTAIKQNQKKIVEWYLDHSIETINSPCEYMGIAARYGNLEIFKSLYYRKYHMIDFKNCHNKIDTWILDGRWDIVLFLIHQKSWDLLFHESYIHDNDVQEWISGCQRDIINFLIQRRFWKPQMIFNTLAHCGQTQLISKHIHKYTIDINEMMKRTGNRACIDTVEYLIKIGGTNYNGAMLAASCYYKPKNIRFVNLMIHYGADDWNGGLAMAIKYNCREFVDFYIEQGAICYIK